MRVLRWLLYILEISPKKDMKIKVARSELPDERVSLEWRMLAAQGTIRK